MKCTQKLCSRSRNLSQNGNCSVCEDVLKNSKIAQDRINKQKTVPKVEVDQYQKVVSGLLLAGVINILSQHDALEHLEEKTKVLEQENLTNRNKIEALENWVMKQDEAISDLSLKLSLKSDKIEEQMPKIKEVPKTFEKTCDVCSKTFQRNSDFENHMIDEHGVEKSFECDICRKTFLLEWRLKKHKQIHTGKIKDIPIFPKQDSLSL